MGHSTPQTNGWHLLAKRHELQPVEIALLMSCKVVEIDEAWQVELMRTMLEEAYDAEDTVRITKLLCSLVRAVVEPTVSTRPLGDVTMRIALRREERVSLPMSSCVRLARVLACKLDALGGLSHISDAWARKECGRGGRVKCA